MRLGILRSLVTALSATILLDWRLEKPGAMLTPEVLRSAFGAAYRNVSDRCNATNITPAALNRLAAMNETGETVMLLFEEEIPGGTPQHEDLALPLARRGVKVAHILDDQIIDALELQRSIDADDDYEFTVWTPGEDSPKEEIAMPTDIKDIEIQASAPISEKCILVDVTLGGFGNRRKVKTSKATKNAEGAIEDVLNGGGVMVADGDPKMIRATKSLMESIELSEINSHDGQTREWLYARCLPSPFQKGIYLLPIRLYARVEAYLKQRMAERTALVAGFVAAIPQRIREAEDLLGGNFNPKDYPSPEEIGTRFVFTRQYMEYAAAGNLERISQEAFEESKATVQRQWAEAGAIATQALRAGMKTIVDHLVDTLTETSATGRRKKIYNSVLPKLNSFLDLFRDRNIANDQELEQLVARARQVVAGVNVDELRDNDRTRQYIGQRFQEIKAQVDTLVTTAPRRAFNLDQE